MPEETNLNDDGSLGFLNVGSSVGKNGVNNIGDVLLIQALFCEVLPYLYEIPGSDTPYPTGSYDRKTAELILKYQELSSTSRRVKVWRDGLINRANGPTVPGKKRVWTITYLNEDLYYVYTSQGYESSYAGGYVQQLIDKYPDLSYYVADYA